MTKARFLSAFVGLCVFCSTASALAAPAEPEHLKIGPLHAGMTFTEFHEAKPAGDWKKREYQKYGVTFTRAYKIRSYKWLGHDFELSFSRSEYGGSELIAATMPVAANQEACLKQVSTLANEVNTAMGGEAAAWTDMADLNNFGRADPITSGFENFTSDNWGRPFLLPEAAKTAKIYKRPGGVPIARFTVKSALVQQNLTGWRSYYHAAGQQVRILGSFDSMTCLASVSIKAKAPFPGDNTPVMMETRLSDLVKSRKQAQRLYSRLLASNADQLLTSGAQQYVCDLDPLEGIENCAAVFGADIADAQKAAYMRSEDAFSRYLSSMSVGQQQVDDDDLRPRRLTITLDQTPEEEIPAFDWSKAVVPFGETGSVKFSVGSLLTMNDFPPGGEASQADLTFRCAILSDYSIYCGDMSVEPAENTSRYQRVHQRFASRMASRRAEPRLKNGEDSAGSYFIVKAKFLVPS